MTDDVLARRGGGRFDTAAGWICLAGAALFVSNCASLKKPPPQPEVLSLPAVSTGVLAELSRDVSRRFGPGKSGFYLFKENEEAMNLRLALADHAQRSIDAQYYLWYNDEAGRLLFGRLLEAAERGVRVRVLVDDFLFTGDDHGIAALSHHPNIEIKIYNPGYVRNGLFGSAFEFLFRFGELNRRMHNKLFVVDNRVAIVGGRNIGDHYYGLSKKYNFLDLDVLTAGPILEDLSHGFDVFWNSEAAYPGREMSQAAGPDDVASAVARVRSSVAEGTALAEKAGYPLKRRDWTAELRALRNKWHGGTGDFFYDEPVTTPGETGERFLDSTPSLADHENPQEVIVVSPYLIPDDDFFESIDRYVGKGARVRILTPAMDANNQALVHSHYRTYRRRILRHGAELYEFRGDALPEMRQFADTPIVPGKTIGLHLKGFVGDRSSSFVGSLNLDPRSVEINTEGGLWIESPGLGEELANFFDLMMAPENAWRVTIEEDRRGREHLRWESRGEVLYRQPAPGFGARMSDFFYGLLPIRNQL